MDCRTPGFPVYHQSLELAQTHVDQVGDAIQPSHLLSSPSPPCNDNSLIISYRETFRVLYIQFNHIYLPIFMEAHFTHTAAARLIDYVCHVLGEGNGTRSRTLAWKIPWTEEPGGLQSMGLLRVGHD